MARHKAHHLDAYVRHNITTLANHGHVAMAHNRGIERATDGMQDITRRTRTTCKPWHIIIKTWHVARKNTEKGKSIMKEEKIYNAIRKVYGYGDEGDKLVEWLIDNLKEGAK